MPFRPLGALLPIAALLVAGPTLPGAALGGPNANARLALHVTPTTSVSVCDGAQARPGCAGLVTAGGLYPPPHFVYLLVMQGDATAGIGGAAVGINYASGATDGLGVDVFAWTLCATIQLGQGNWPDPGGSLIISWDTLNHCQQFEPDGPGTGVTATAGYFYVGAYSDSEMWLINEVRPNRVQVASCGGTLDDIEDSSNPNEPSRLGRARFSAGASEAGYNPCESAIPVVPASWSRLKAVAAP